MAIDDLPTIGPGVGDPLSLAPPAATPAGTSPFGGISLSTGGIGSIAGGVSDLFASMGYKAKAQGDAFEQQNYLLAGTLADQNEQYTEWSTGIKQAQEDRELFKSLGTTKADIAGAGLAESGSALDILRESASQGAMARAVTGEQGLIAEAGYREQAQSYRNMAAAAQVAIDAENKAAKGAEITGILKGAAGGAAMGAAAGPWGALAGGIIGAGAAYFGGKAAGA
jgi:hypothetical protein